MKKSLTRVVVLAVVTMAMVAFASPAWADTFTVTNTNDSGTGSLRQAVADAGADSGKDTVTFDIPGAGPHTIQLNGTIDVNHDLDIVGPTNESVTVRGNNASQVFAFYGGVGVSASLSNLKPAGGPSTPTAPVALAAASSTASVTTPPASTSR